MSDHWEVVGGPKKKPKVGNGQPKVSPQPQVVARPTNVSTKTAKAKRKKHVGPREEKIARLPSFEDEEDEVGACTCFCRSNTQSSEFLKHTYTCF